MTTTFQQFIVETFSETELLILCDSDDALQKVKAEFSESMPLGEKVRRLIGFCKRRRLTGILWVKVKEERKEQWAAYQMPDKEPDSPVGQMRENLREVEGIFREIKSIENMDSQAVSPEGPVDKTHPLAQGDAEVKKWFAEELNTDEQVFLLTAALFSGLEKHEFMQIYDGINLGLQAPAEKVEENKK
ncbi:MAG: hypothetical protein WA821_16045 [Anaerolineales bacterium]